MWTLCVRGPEKGGPKGPPLSGPRLLLGCFRVSGAPLWHIRRGVPSPDIARFLSDPELGISHIVTRWSQSEISRLPAKAKIGKKWSRLKRDHFSNLGLGI